VRALTAEKPTITLGDYKKAVAGLHAHKKAKIWVPAEEKKEEDKAAQVTVGEILDVLAKEIKIELSPLILDQEVNRQLSNLIDQTQKLGMTIEQYLQSQGKTSDQLRQEYKSQSEKTLALEFALEEIAERENIVVADAEIDTVIKNAKTEAERTSLASQRYYIASLLRRQKTINTLLEPSPITV
jgi:FKBP-type peptidyl-prolyl cis-trans isomerase (trigger factor)